MKIKWLVGGVILVVLVVYAMFSIYPDWLWFQSLGFSSVFSTMIRTRFGFGLAVWLFLILIIAVNLIIAGRLSPISRTINLAGRKEDVALPAGLSANTLNVLFLILVLIVGFLIANKGSERWDVILRYFYDQPFGISDPVFGKDIGFYVFALPFYVFIRNGLLLLFAFAAGITIIWYLKNGSLQIVGEIIPEEGKQPGLPRIVLAPGVRKHLVLLGGVIVALFAWGYYLKIYALLYSAQGPAFGASYTDVHVKIWALRFLILVSFAFAVLLFINISRPANRWILIGGGVWVGSILLFSMLLPLMVQKFVVKPNELTKESKYIAYNIDYTRRAYNLNRIKEVDFQVNDTLSLEEVKKQDATIQNIRIWDERPLLQTYRQIQAIRLYYDFNNVDVGRYTIGNKYRQLMLAAREMVVSQLPPQANTWVNRHLTYTHGYGLTASPVNEVTSEGLPRLFIKDLPPVSEIDLKIDRPEIYYGEKTDQFVLVNSRTKEFDYPKGDKNVYANYQGKGGVPIHSFLRRLLYAVEFRDPQILFTNYLGPESRIMYKRAIHRRVKAIAPFLAYDRDPYLVISEGRLYWFLDAYTTSDMYPYSTRSHVPFNKDLINYIRNSVKVVIDAYDGHARFYLMDESDPIAAAYKAIFPDLLKPFEKMPEDLKKHIRYPKDLFDIQAAAYAKYHMEDARVFYNQEDLWQLPDEKYGDSRLKMEPYYIIIKLPEGEKEEFLLMLPFTPSKKDNMIGWLAARSDIPNYGDLIVYKLPKDKLIYGPMQIEARVDQQTEISRELSLWDQKGSSVIRGNLLAIPVCDSFIYVEPVYLEAKQHERPGASADEASSRSLGKSRKSETPAPPWREKARTSALPELKRVIAAFGNRVAMEENLDQALMSVLGGRGIVEERTVSVAVESLHSSSLGLRALEHYNNAKAFLRQGNWTGYGEELNKMEAILRKLGKQELGNDPSLK